MFKTRITDNDGNEMTVLDDSAGIHQKLAIMDGRFQLSSTGVVHPRRADGPTGRFIHNRGRILIVMHYSCFIRVNGLIAQVEHASTADQRDPYQPHPGFGRKGGLIKPGHRV